MNLNEKNAGVTTLRDEWTRRTWMERPEDVEEMLRLHRLGVGTRRIAETLGCSRTTVKGHIAQGGWRPYATPEREGKLAGLEQWLAERYRQHRGNADVVRQELEREKDITVSLRTVERAVAPFRRELIAERKATTRFETPPGRQLQIDFGSTRVEVDGETIRVYVFVATLGYSRRPYVAAFRHERQSAWFAGLEGAFRHFGGVPEEVLLDNAKPLVDVHDTHSGEVVFNDRLAAFAAHWGFKPRACMPYRARTKGKDESGVGYVKGNALAGHRFPTWSALESHLTWWTREVADIRHHGTTGERPIDRFEAAERAALKPLGGRPDFQQVREVTRRVRNDCGVELDTNTYSVPWRLIGEDVRVQAAHGTVTVFHGTKEVARHRQSLGRRQRITDKAHFAGITRDHPAGGPDDAPPAPPASSLLRPLTDYQSVVEEVG